MSNSTEAYAANCFLPLNFWSLIVCFDRNFDAKSGGIINFPVSLFSDESATTANSVSYAIGFVFTKMCKAKYTSHPHKKEHELQHIVTKCDDRKEEPTKKTQWR